MQSTNALLRKYENDLNVSGTGVILLGAWSIIKGLLEIIFNFDMFEDFRETFPENPISAYVILAAIILIFIAIIISLHLFVGLNAIRDSKGGKFRRGYPLYSFIMVIFTFLTMFTYRDKFSEIKDIDTAIVSVLVDITTIYVFWSVFRSSARVKELRQNVKSGIENDSVTGSGTDMGSNSEREVK